MKTVILEEKLVQDRKNKEILRTNVNLPENKKRMVSRNASRWLNVIPKADDHYDLSQLNFEMLCLCVKGK